MRLIDADKIEYIMGEKPRGLDYVRRAHIAHEPTVKAIPMWFLEQWFGDNYNALTDLQMEWEKECRK